MEKLIRKYADKLVAQGLVDPPGPLIGGLDADMMWNRPDRRQMLLERGVTEVELVMQGKTYYQTCLEAAGSHPVLMQGPFESGKEAPEIGNRVYLPQCCSQFSAFFSLSWGSGMESKSTSLNNNSTESSFAD